MLDIHCHVLVGTGQGQPLSGSAHAHNSAALLCYSVQVAWAHPKFGSLLASGSFDNRVIIWKETADNVWTQVHSWATGCLLLWWWARPLAVACRAK